MAKKATKKAAKKAKARGAVKSSKSAVKAKTARPAKAVAKKLSPKKAPAKAVQKTARATALPAGDGKLTFNHAMIYVKDVNRALGFYRDLLGFKLIEDFRFDGTPVYARLRAPSGDGTIALHQAGASASIASEGVRL